MSSGAPKRSKPLNTSQTGGSGLEQGMDFWPAYYKESLGEPWLIHPEGGGTSAPAFEGSWPVEDIVFLSSPLSDDKLQNMLGKMVVAIQLNRQQVAFEYFDNPSLEVIAAWGGKKKIIAFGKEFSSGLFGEAFMLGPHKVIVTHSLSDLNQKPDLKKETWEHLKTFARLK